MNMSLIHYLLVNFVYKSTAIDSKILLIYGSKYPKKQIILYVIMNRIFFGKPYSINNS